MKKIRFNAKELVSVMAEAVTSAYLLSIGASPEQAKLIGSCISSLAKGLSLSEQNSSTTILTSIEKTVVDLADNSSVELPENCKDFLREDVLSPQKIIQFMCQQDPRTALKKQIIDICERDPDCDIGTLPVDELVTQIIEAFDQATLSSHELASYAAYCMLRSYRVSPVIYTANLQYASSFTEPLFLHKKGKNSRVNLLNLFIMPKYKVINDGHSNARDAANNSRSDLQKRIADFLRNDNLSFLFIEGDAGCGKTTLAAWMNYHYYQNDEVSNQLFGDRPLVTIRLRDLDKKDISTNASLSSAIRKYMHLTSLDELEQFFPKAIMLLDGFDELCMIEKINFNRDELLYDLQRKGLQDFNFIITTRPKFVSTRINLPNMYISLQHFDAEQRTTWLNQYTSIEYCSQPIDETICEYIKSIGDDTSSCICDTPMTLYMLAAKKVPYDILNNSWSLYHHIFYEELSETEYNKMFPNPDRNYVHGIHILRDVLYQISEEIAYLMYQRGNQSFYLSDKELSDIIITLSEQIPILKQANMKEIAQHCYALCCYWKANADRGVVEFLHNNIRDFFLAEKIYREMDKLANYAKQECWNSGKYTVLIGRKLCSLFQYGALETKVCEFIFLRAAYNAEKSIFDFAQYGYQNTIVGSIISVMSRNELYSDVMSRHSSYNPVELITNILSCTVQIYRNVYEVYLGEKDTIPWLPHKGHNHFLETIFKPVFCQVPVTISYDHMITLGSRGYFRSMDFKAHDLRNIGFQHSQIEKADFSDAILCGCDFSYAKLDGSNFSNADIHYASFENASLNYCDLIGADIRGTELPDGFVSNEQDEQVEHLKSLNIPGLKI